MERDLEGNLERFRKRFKERFRKISREGFRELYLIFLLDSKIKRKVIGRFTNDDKRA